VQATCKGFIVNEDDDTPVQKALFNTCGVMVKTGNQIITGEINLGGLNLTQDQLAAGLQQIATEEFANTESVANEIATNRQDPVIARLVAVRSGIAGFTVQGLSPDNAEQIADNEWLDSVQGMRGGSAGNDTLGSAWSGFLNFSYGIGSRDQTERSNGFDYDSYNVTLGGDYRFGSNVVVGAALNYYRVDSAFDQEPTVAGGDLDTDGWGGTAYATYYGERFYIDGLAGYAVSDYDIRRNIIIASNNPDIGSIAAEATGATNSADYAVSVGAGGYFGQGGFGWGPYGRLTFTRVDIDSYQEKGAEHVGLNLDVEEQDWTSLISALGAQFSYTFSQSYGVIAPQLQLGWVHQFENDSQDIVATYTADPRQFALVATTDDPDRDYAELGLAVTAVFQGGSQVFFSYDTLLGFELLTSHLFTVGGRLEF
jgi:uncharacterized protein YhjY with autotransporter beta-barrel domain